MSRLNPWWFAAVAAAVAAIGLAVGLGRAGDVDPVLAGPATSASPTTGSMPSAELDLLRAELEQETFEREMLAAEVELMRSVIEQIAAERSPEVAAPDELARKPAVDQPPGPRDLDEQLLSQIGLSEREVFDLRDRWDRAQLDKLELNDRAAREGWLLRPRHRKQLDALDVQLRQELGETGYDQMLYATDQPNRVVVNSVIGGSAAALAGVREGDHLLSYGGERMFTPADVRRGTTAGTRGEPVRIVVERGGEPLSFVVPRGPLGTRMSPLLAPPSR